MIARLCGSRWTGTLRTPGRVLDLEQVRSISYRSPETSNSRRNSARPNAARLHRGQVRVGGVLSALPALWVNHPPRIADAAYQPLQLVHATRCGLTVPPTLITTS